MKRKTYPRWVESKPKEKGSICYFVAGYGCIVIGESGNPLQRSYSTLFNKKWAALFLWINLHQFGIFDTINRKHLEALIIFSVANNRKRWAKNIFFENIHYTRTLGSFNKRKFHHTFLIELLLSNFIDYINSKVDSRGNYLTDVHTWSSKKVTDEARAAAYSRLCTNKYGPNCERVPVRYIELRLSPYREE